jgi:hypothetical protein
VVLALVACATLARPAARVQQALVGRTLLATVIDALGRPRVDFDRDDFVVNEDSAERDVLDVRIADYPLVVLVDDGETAAGPAIRNAVARFVSRVGDRPVAIGTLSNVSLVATLDDSRADVLAKIAGMIPGASTAGQALASIAHAAELLAGTGAPFSAIVVVSAAVIDATQLVQGELLPVITGSGAAVHVVSNRPLAREGIAADAPDILRVLADETRGQYTAIFSPASYSIALDRLADRLASEMLVDYLAPADAKKGDVRVGVRRPGARVLGLGVSK